MKARLARRAVVAAAVAATSMAAWPAGASAARYVAIGDSYSSGVGTREYYKASGGCKRGPHAYPKLVNFGLDQMTGRNQSHAFVACAGAETPDIWKGQLTPLDRRTRWVTISIGGNDAGFGDVVYECAKPEWASACEGEVEKARRFIRESLSSRLRAVYRAINRRTTSRAVKVAVGYPRLFNGEDCNGGTWFDADDMEMINATANLLARVQRRVARRAGFAFLDPRRAFTGHAVCDPQGVDQRPVQAEGRVLPPEPRGQSGVRAPRDAQDPRGGVGLGATPGRPYRRLGR